MATHPGLLDSPTNRIAWRRAALMTTENDTTQGAGPLGERVLPLTDHPPDRSIVPAGHVRGAQMLAVTDHSWGYDAMTGIIRHLQFALGLRRRPPRMSEKLIHDDTPYPLSITVTLAMILLGIALLATASIAFEVAPFD